MSDEFFSNAIRLKGINGIFTNVQAEMDTMVSEIAERILESNPPESIDPVKVEAEIVDSIDRWLLTAKASGRIRRYLEAQVNK